MGSKTYPINSGLAQYRGVPIYHEGSVHPGGCRGKAWEMTEAKIKAFAASYNPLRWPVATIDFDHEGNWIGGQSNGIITRLYAEQREVDGAGRLWFLMADLANIPLWLADMIDDGLFPHRSAEGYDAPFMSEVWDVRVESCRWYGVEDFYVDRLSLMGQFNPAFPHLGPMPARYAPESAEESADPPLEYLAPPLAASAGQTRPYRIAAMLETHPSKEALMGDTAQDKTRQGGGPPVTTAAQTTTAPASPPDGGEDTVESLRAQLSVLSRELETSREREASRGKPQEDAETAALRAQLAELQADKRARAAKEELAEIKASIGLLPCEEPIVAEILSACHEDEQLGSVKLTIRAKDAKGQISEQETSIAGALRMLLATRERPKGGLVTSSHESHQPGSQAQQLTATAADEATAKAMQGTFPGITAAECAAYRQTKQLPERFTAKGNGGTA